MTGLSVSAPISLISTDTGDIVGATDLAVDLFGGRTILSGNRTIAATSATARTLLTQAIQCTATAQGRQEPQAIPLSLPHDALAWLYIVRQLPADAVQQLCLSSTPVCWVELRAPDYYSLPSLDFLRSALQLSKKETEVVRALLGGQAPVDHAKERGVTREAERFHFKNIYQKTGCRSYIQLMALVSSLIGPHYVPSSQILRSFNESIDDGEPGSDA